MPPPPSGTLTFLFTDIEGSTRLWQDFGDEMRVALEVHDGLIRAAVDAARGYVFATGGDGFGVAFSRAADAVDCAIAIQRTLRTCDWGEGPALRVRIGLHSGHAQERGGNYFGGDVSMAARVMSVAHGGQIVVSPAAAGLAGNVELLDLGEHGLRDIDGMHVLAQVMAEGIDAAFPPIRTTTPEAVCLPVQRSPLIGRDDDVATIRRLLGQHRLVTLAGPGGAGKTRLAIEVAARQLEQTRGGVFFVELAPVTDTAGLTAALVQASGIGVDRSAPALGQVLGWLARRAVTLVFDNCEHIIDDAAELIDDILRVAPEVRIIATSRESLGLDGERTVRVAGLPAGDAGSAAVQLFCERAAAVSPEFAVSAAEMAAIVEICDHLDGIPLAIELAAARVRTLDPIGIRDRLDDRFRLLTGSRKASRRRQATLERTIDWSYDLLDVDEQRFLRHLAVFPSSFDHAGAAAIGSLDETDTLDLLDALVDKSLLNTVPGLAAHEFRMLETIREYGIVKLIDAGESVEARDRHAEYWRRWLVLDDDSLDAYYRALTPDRFALIRARSVDLVAMLNWLWERGRHHEVAWPLSLLTSPLWIPEARVDEAWEWMERCADSVPDDADAQFWFAFARAWTATYRGDRALFSLIGVARRLAGATPLSWYNTVWVRFLEIAVRVAVGLDTRELAEETVTLGRKARADHPTDPLGLSAYAQAVAFRGAVRAMERDLTGALDDYAEALRNATAMDFEVMSWVRIGEVTCLHLLGRHEEARSAVVRLDRVRSTLAAEWQHELDIASWIALAGAGDDADTIRRTIVERLVAERGQARWGGVQSTLSLLGILAVLCGEPERARTLLQHSTGAAFVHSQPLHWYYLAQVEGWPDTEFDARRSAHFWATLAPETLPAATELLEQEVDRLRASPSPSGGVSRRGAPPRGPRSATAPPIAQR